MRLSLFRYQWCDTRNWPHTPLVSSPTTTLPLHMATSPKIQRASQLLSDHIAIHVKVPFPPPFLEIILDQKELWHPFLGLRRLALAARGKFCSGEPQKGLPKPQNLSKILPALTFLLSPMFTQEVQLGTRPEELRFAKDKRWLGLRSRSFVPLLPRAWGGGFSRVGIRALAVVGKIGALAGDGLTTGNAPRLHFH